MGHVFHWRVRSEARQLLAKGAERTNHWEEALREVLALLPLIGVGVPVVVELLGERRRHHLPASEGPMSTECTCQTCWTDRNNAQEPVRVGDALFHPIGAPFIVCATCGNKRCPHATDHRNPCTNSNEPGQKGSVYEGCE